MIPELRVIKQVERGIGDQLMVWRASNTEVVLAPIQPRQRIARSVKTWENLACGTSLGSRYRPDRPPARSGNGAEAQHPEVPLGRWRDRVVIVGVPVCGTASGSLQCSWFAAVRVPPALLQAYQCNAKRLLLLIDVTNLAGERANDFFQPIEP
jgi:hypothetical protein